VLVLWPLALIIFFANQDQTIVSVVVGLTLNRGYPLTREMYNMSTSTKPSTLNLFWEIIHSVGKMYRFVMLKQVVRKVTIVF